MCFIGNFSEWYDVERVKGLTGGGETDIGFSQRIADSENIGAGREVLDVRLAVELEVFPDGRAVFEGLHAGENPNVPEEALFESVAEGGIAVVGRRQDREVVGGSLAEIAHLLLGVPVLCLDGGLSLDDIAVLDAQIEIDGGAVLFAVALDEAERLNGAAEERGALGGVALMHRGFDAGAGEQVVRLDDLAGRGVVVDEFLHRVGHGEVLALGKIDAGDAHRDVVGEEGILRLELFGSRRIGLAGGFVVLRLEKGFGGGLELVGGVAAARRVDHLAELRDGLGVVAEFHQSAALQEEGVARLFGIREILGEAVEVFGSLLGIDFAPGVILGGKRGVERTELEQRGGVHVLRPRALRENLLVVLGGLLLVGGDLGLGDAQRIVAVCQIVERGGVDAFVLLLVLDIALIQGPPGTGKTTVIAAIVERLNEEADKRGGIQGRVLLTGFQHDAVENIIQRLTINGLPVPKFGKRSGEKTDRNVNVYQHRLQEWCLSHAADLRKKNPQITESLQEKGLRGRSVQYVKTPSLSLAISLLEEALTLSDRILGVDLRNRLQTELKRLRVEQDTTFTENPALPIVRNLRVTEAGFSDDGPERASELLFTIKNELEKNDQEILSQAGKWSNKQEKPPFLKELQNLKRKLLRKYTPAPIFRVEKARDSIINLIKEILSQIRTNGSSVNDKKSAALAELLITMENNPQGIMTAVNDYSFAFAATCQQSVNLPMETMMGVAPDVSRQNIEYDYVIVDEAARVSPRDLMIPMVQGKRIILVGDHRQLPQLIDEEVARQMENGTENGENNDWLKKSMFEYLFTERIPALEKMDGIKRRVTLDRQYRTHPILGDFISRNFYERFNPEEKFTSGRAPEDFAHTLPGVEGKCAVWMDIPISEGNMMRSSNGMIRPAEAHAICKKLREWIEYDCENESDSKKQLTFGVISFYKAQTEQLKYMLKKDFDRYINEFKLRIGTVDSFQGMEFDVVFLSLVRTGKSGFGFLKLYNRLNVSMSRQKKLLVAVGDAAFYNTDQAREQVPGLADFLKVCRNQGRVL